MSKYIDVHQRLRTFLKGSSGTYPDQILLDGINSATVAILPWLPKEMTANGIIVTSGSLIKLPDDVYYVDAVYSVTGEQWLKHWSINPGATSARGTVVVPQWVEYPEGYLTLSCDYSDNTVNVFYHGLWTAATTTGSATENMDTPSFADLAIIYYAASYVLNSSAVSSAQLRQFNTKIDSGQPVDNPLKDMVNLLMQRFMNEVKLFPAFERAQK